MFPVVSLPFRLLIIQHTKFPHQIYDFHLAIVILDNFHDPFYIINPHSICPVYVKTNITVGILKFFLVESLQLVLYFSDELLVKVLVDF